jgi:PAS domain S-box-containing protein
VTVMARGTEPTGEERLVGVEDLFFSTTDRRGVITAGNSVFARLSVYSVDELVGAPHNIIRHPEMPAAAFKAMWDRLLAGKPMAAYVKNLAKDGAAYWVFATVTPLGDGFLSVRISPMTALFGAAQNLYDQLLASERDARASGLNRAQAAALGAAELERAIQLLGFPDYEHFMLDALPAEMAARAELLTGRFAGHGGQGPVAEILGGAAALDHDLGLLVGRLNAYHELSAALWDASQSMLGAASQLENAATAAREGSARATGAPVLYSIAQAMVVPSHETTGTLRSVVTELRLLRELVTDLRFRIALARLHADMVAKFAVEVADGGAPPRSLGQVPLLCQTLHEGVEHMAATMTTVNARLSSVAQQVGQAGQQFNDFRRFIGKWRLLVLRHRASGDLAGYIDPIDQMLNDTHGQLSMLHALAGRCKDEIFPFNGPALDAQLARIQRAVRYLLSAYPPPPLPSRAGASPRMCSTRSASATSSRRCGSLVNGPTMASSLPIR